MLFWFVSNVLSFKGGPGHFEVTSSDNHLISPLHTFELGWSAGRGEVFEFKEMSLSDEETEGGRQADGNGGLTFKGRATEVETEKKSRGWMHCW